VELPRSRRARDDAKRDVEVLAQHITDSDCDYYFRHAVTSVFAIGAVIDSETRSRTTARFHEWWKQTQKDPRYLRMKKIRDAALKRAEITTVEARLGHSDVRVRFAVAASAEDRIVNHPRLVRRPRRATRGLPSRSSTGSSTITRVTAAKYDQPAVEALSLVRESVSYTHLTLPTKA